jgi:hypothetical protein
MCKFNFRFLVALLTFGIGVLVAYYFYWSQPIKEVSQENQVSHIEQNKVKTEPPIRKLKYTCNDADIINLRTQLRIDEFLNRYEQEELKSESYANSEINCSDLYEVKRIDLNEDGNLEVIVRTNNPELSSVRGNSPLWIFQKSERTYQEILFNEASFDYEVQNKLTKGFKDIKIDQNSSGGNHPSYIDVYKFNGKKYQVKECFAEEWTDKNKTRIIRQKCESPVS